MVEDDFSDDRMNIISMKRIQKIRNRYHRQYNNCLNKQMNMKEIEAVVQCTLHVINLAKKSGKCKLSGSVRHNFQKTEFSKNVKEKEKLS